jgi:hypothetical protein
VTIPWCFSSDVMCDLVSLEPMNARQISVKMIVQGFPQWAAVMAFATTLSASTLAGEPAANRGRPRVDWTTLPSTYSHSQNGQRVDRFRTEETPLAFEQSNLVRSGYRHSRSTLQAGFSSDHYHSVEQWGAPARPYGEWRYPYRPFAVPYGEWGPQLPLQFNPAFLGQFGQPIPWNGSGPIGIPGTGAGPVSPISPIGPSASPMGYGPFAGPFPHSGQFPFWNNRGGNGWFGVGPGNVVSPTQDDYYPAAPILPPAPAYHPIHNGLE